MWKKENTIETADMVQHWRQTPDAKGTLRLTATLELKIPDCCDNLEEFLSDYNNMIRQLYSTYDEKCFSNMLLKTQVYHNKD